MSSNRISKIKRIAILSELVEKYYGESKIVEKVRLAKDLADVIDDLKRSNLELSEFADEFMNFFPEHWKMRTQFLLIVTKYWPEILKELNLEDITIDDQSILLPHRSVMDFNKIAIIESEDIYAEISEIVGIIKANPREKISIVSPNKDLSRYLLFRLDEENILYNSFVGHSIQSEKFINEIKENFNNSSESEIKQIVNELSELDEMPINSSDISIINLGDISNIQGGIAIYTELNENDWTIRNPGAFWLHYSLRKKLGIAQNPGLIEDLFYFGIEKSKQTFIMRSLKSNGQSNKKSSILAKLEAMAKKSKIQLKTINQRKSNEKQFNQPNFLIKSNNFKFPPEISDHGIELLMKDPFAFYAKEILNLKPQDHDDKQRDIMIAFRNITKSFFENKPIDPWLDVIKKSDFFAYQKAIDLLDFFKKLNCDFPAQNNLRGEFDLKQFNTTIYGYADRLVENLESSTLISFQFSSNQSTKEIIYGNNSSLLTICLIAEKNGFETISKPIRKIQIWNLLSIDKSQIISKELEISKEIIDNFEKRLFSTFETYFENDGEINCQPAPKQLYNKYKHFERL